MDILSVVLPIFLLIALGFVLRKTNVMKPEWVHIENSLVYSVGLPALIITSFWNVDWNTPGLLRLVGLNFLFLLGFALALGILLALLPMNRRVKASIFLVGLVGNTIYMGFPLGMQAFGAEAASTVVGVGTLFLVFGIMVAIVGIEIFWQPERLISYLKNFVKNPLILGVVAGVAVSFIHDTTGIAGIVRETVGMIGALASPLALIALGGFLFDRFDREVVWFATLATGIKLLAFPIVFFFVDILIGGGGVREVGVSMLLGAMPAAVTTLAVAEQFDLDQSLVASTVVVSTVASVVTVPLVLSLWA